MHCGILLECVDSLAFVVIHDDDWRSVIEHGIF